ncbi:MAG: glycoside hydrolase family 88 protein [Cyclobacteriaceae bacterium]|nr:glycoside hydrolase family 88 protein [Cyclobacteriaceae bacterium]
MKALIPALLISLILSACGGQEKKSSTEGSTKDQSLYVLMANSEMKRNPDPRLLDFRDKPKWEYTNGLVCSAFLQVWEKTGDPAYYNYAKSYADSMITADGNILTYKKTDYNIDRVNPGKFLMVLYKNTQDIKYKMAIDTLRDQMRTHPRNADGGFWHKQIYPHQMWLDGLYMGSPFLAQYAAEFNEPALFDDVANQIDVMDKHAWDQEKGLYFHGWDESRQQQWADPVTGRSPHAWGRAMGWYAMALVDVLDFFPVDHPARPAILAVHKKMADAIIAHQDTSGLWWQVLDQPGREGNYLEASASSMFTYFLLKSANKGYLDAKYLEAGKKGFKSIADQLIKKNEDGTISLTQVCGVAGLGGDPYRDGTFEYYVNEVIRDNDPKGVGPFIMAAILYEQINN